MLDTLQPGLTNSMTIEVVESLSPPHLAPTIVLSTPNMVQLMESCSLQTVQPHLGPTETTVGTHVNVSHEAAARGGETVTIDAELIETSKRRLTFAVVVRVEDRIIGQGTHERAVIDTARFA